MDFADVVRARRSVRSFLPDGVADETLRRILDAACLAPSARDEQPWRFHVTRGDTRREVGSIVAQTTGYLTEYVDVLGEEGFDKAVKWYSSLGDAPVVIVVSLPESENESDAANRLLSAGCAMENLLLAAADEGLGTCTVTFSHWVRDDLARLLGIGSDRSIVAIIALGVPAESDLEPRTEHTGAVEWFD